MFKRILIGASSAAFLTLGACDALLESESSCLGVQNNTQSMAGDTVVTTSGLRYIETRVGTGATARSCERVQVDYTLRFTDGRLVEEGEPFFFVPGERTLIPGFEQGVLGMKEGGERRLIVPPALGYGAGGSASIPGNTTIVFDVVLLAVE